MRPRRTTVRSKISTGWQEEGRLQRRDLEVLNRDGLRLFVRELWDPHGRARQKPPILLPHSARLGSLALYDLATPSRASFAAQLAIYSGRRVFLLDASGFGFSETPLNTPDDPGGAAPLVRSSTAMWDLHAVVQAVVASTGCRKVCLVGFAAGSHWSAHYATLQPERVSRLVYINGLWSIGEPWAPGAAYLESMGHPASGDSSSLGAYRVESIDAVAARWRKDFREPGVFEHFKALALGQPDDWSRRNPGMMRIPNGPLADAFDIVAGRGPWRASAIRAPTLIMRGEADFWSRPGDPLAFAAALSPETPRRLVTLPGEAHFTHAYPTNGRERLLAEIVAFLD